ncbi:MAG: restriction endonuclease subunit S, partial [Bacteroidota bacterium]|nr:restriction endonuclease subunit S [Bacteroidota bacterium]
QRRPIKQNDLPGVFRKLTEYRDKLMLGEDVDFENETLVSLVEKEKIAENGEFNLSGERYKELKLIDTNFPLIKLNEIADFKNGLWKGKKEPFKTVKIIRNTNFGKHGELCLDDVAEHPVEVKQLESRKLQKGDIILENSGGGPTQPVGRVIYFDVKDNDVYSWSNFTSRIRVNVVNRVHPKYLFYSLNHLYELGFTENLQKRTSGIRNLDKNAYGNLQIPLPPISVQEEIVAEIESYQKIIDGARQVVENYKPKIDIDPEWEMVELGKTCKVNEKAANPTDLYSDWFTYIDIASVENGTGVIDYNNKMKVGEAPSRARRVIQKDDILLSTVRPNLKAFGYIDKEPERFIASTGFAVLKADINQLIPKFLYYLIFQDIVLSQMINRMGKGSYPSINQNDVKNLKIPLPDLDKQNRIVAQIEKEYKAVSLNKLLIENFEQKIKDRIAKVWGE